LKRSAFIASILFCCPVLFSQTAVLVLENKEIRIGEPATIHISFSYPNPDGTALIGWPQYNDKLTDELEILDRTVDFESLSDSVNQIYTREQNLQITGWEEGVKLIPQQTIEFNDSIFYTNAEFITVHTVDVDTSKSITDIKENYEEFYPWNEQAGDWFLENWYWFAGAAILALFFLLYRIVKKRKDTITPPPSPPIPAHITALNALHELRLNEAWKSGDKKLFYSQMTDTIRLYLEQRFDIFAMEQTTREILQHLKRSDISDQDKDFLRGILHQADMVKFAKFLPGEDDGYQSLLSSIDLVERTRQVDDVKPQADENPGT